MPVVLGAAGGVSRSSVMPNQSLGEEGDRYAYDRPGNSVSAQEVIMNILKMPVAVMAALLAACGGSDSSPRTGQVSVQVTDAPVDAAESVVVRFTGISFKPADEAPVEVVFLTPKDIDLLALAGGDAAPLVSNLSVPAGAYEWMRLHVDAEFDAVYDSYIRIDGSQHELRVPSGSESGLKLNGGFVVPQGGVASYTLDFDLRKSVVEPVGQPGYFLKPVIRMVNTAQVGMLTGVVDTALVASACTGGETGAVYLYPGVDVVPDDVDGASPDPLASGALTLQGDGTYRYTIAFLSPGSYTAAWTCDAAQDVPESSEDLVFTPGVNVSISTGVTTVQDFAP